MSWWNKKSQVNQNKNQTIRLPRLDDGKFRKLQDPNATCCYLESTCPKPMVFISTLELNYPFLEEAKDWKSWTLQPGEKKLVPHRFWHIEPLEGDTPRTFNMIEIPKNHEPVEYLYKIRGMPTENTPPVSAGEIESQSADSDKHS